MKIFFSTASPLFSGFSNIPSTSALFDALKIVVYITKDKSC